MNASDKTPSNALCSLMGLTLLGLATVVLFFIIQSHLWPAMGRFGDAAMGRAYLTIIGAVLIPALVAVGQFLVCIGTKSRSLRFPGWVMSGMTVVALLVLACSVVYSMRPLPKYDPQDYQHLLGQHLDDARDQLDCRRAVSGAESGNGKSFRILSLRGMRIVATPDGKITEVREGLRD